MKVEEVIKVLTEFNKWRKGAPPYEFKEDPCEEQDFPYSAREIGLAIDEAVNMLRQEEYMIERANNVITANSKRILALHKDAEVALATAAYILNGTCSVEEVSNV